MNHQTSNGERDISAHIGALELGAINAIDDGAFEATVHAGPNAQVTLLRNSRRGCEFVDVNDDALEASALSMGPPPNATMQLQCLTRVGCSRIDDGALEATVQVGPSTMPPACRFRIDDDALEATVQAGPQRPTAIRLPGGGCLPGVDDGALEASVATVYAGPTGMTCPPPQTLRPMCRYIDDSVLEASVLSMWNPTLDPRCRTHRCY